MITVISNNSCITFAYPRVPLLLQKTTMNYIRLLTVMAKILEWLSSWWMICWTTRAQHRTQGSLLQLTYILVWPQRQYCMRPNK